MRKTQKRIHKKKKKENFEEQMKQVEKLHGQKDATSLVAEHELLVTPNINNPEKIINAHVSLIFKKCIISLANKMFKFGLSYLESEWVT